MSPLSWRWGPGGKLGLGAALGLALVSVALVLIACDLASGGRDYDPPAWYGGPDLEVEHHQVCADPTGRPVVDLELVRRHAAVWDGLCWPRWPEPQVMPPGACDGQQAPPGTVRWHSCDELQEVDGVLVPPCVLFDEPGVIRRAVTWSNFVGSAIASADIYVQTRGVPLDDCVYAHEAGHARGLIGSLGQDGHSDDPRSLMFTSCPSDYTVEWLDRCDGGDWRPTGEEED